MHCASALRSPCLTRVCSVRRAYRWRRRRARGRRWRAQGEGHRGDRRRHDRRRASRARGGRASDRDRHARGLLRRGVRRGGGLKRPQATLGPGDRVRLIRDRTQDNRDAYDRLLRYVELRGRDIGRRQVRRGTRPSLCSKSRSSGWVPIGARSDAPRMRTVGVWGACGGDFTTRCRGRGAERIEGRSGQGVRRERIVPAAARSTEIGAAGHVVGGAPKVRAP